MRLPPPFFISLKWGEGVYSYIVYSRLVSTLYPGSTITMTAVVFWKIGSFAEHVLWESVAPVLILTSEQLVSSVVTGEDSHKLIP